MEDSAILDLYANDLVLSVGSAWVKRVTFIEHNSWVRESLLIWRNAFFVTDHVFDCLDGVVGVYIQSDLFSSEGPDKNLHLYLYLIWKF